MAIWKNDDKVFCFKIYVTDSFGNTKQIKRQSKTWKKKSDVEAAIRDLYNEYGFGSSMTLTKLAEEYFKHLELTRKKSTLRTLRGLYYKNIDPYLGKYAIDKIDNKLIMAWHRTILELGFSNHYLMDMQSLLRSILQFGVKCNYLLKNPYTIDHVTNGEEMKEDYEVLSVDSFNRFLAYVPDHVYKTLYIVLFWAGLRIGEALALRISDIDFKNGIISVTKTYNYASQELTSPKTKSSIRNLSVNKTVLEYLSKQIASYQYLPDVNPDKFIFGYDKPFYYTYFRNYHEKWVADSGMKYFKIHSLRHSCVSVLISLGVQPFFIAKRMGHSVDMVNKVYGHMYPNDDRAIVNMQEKLAKQKN